MLLYAEDNDGRYPFNEIDMSAAGCFRLLDKYLDNPRVFTCPSDRQTTPSATMAGLTATNISYSYEPYLAIQTGTPLPVVFDRINAITNGATWTNHSFGGKAVGNVLFTDFHVESHPVWEFSSQKQGQAMIVFE